MLSVVWIYPFQPMLLLLNQSVNPNMNTAIWSPINNCTDWDEGRHQVMGQLTHYFSELHIT